MGQQEQGLQKLDDLIKQALKAGADAADAVLAEGASLGVSWRNGKIETLEHSEGGDLGLRVLIGKRQAVVSSTDHRPETLAELVDRAISMARLAPEDPYCGLADPSDIARQVPDLDLYDPTQVEASDLIEKVKEAEEAALSVSGVKMVESADAGASSAHICLVASNGFSGAYKRSHFSLSTSVLAGEGTGMERDGEYRTTVYRSDLPSPADIGRKAAENTVRNLGARKMPSCQVPVIFERDEAAGLLGCFVGAILGTGIARGTSFLKDFLGKQVFAEGITIVDDPFRPRGLRSKAFDAEGLLPAKRNVVENGILRTWLMDLRSARKLGLKSTGHASRGISGMPAPSCTNLFMQAGQRSVDELIADIKQGFYVTETMGNGINGVTGDYSMAARGFWIENGTIAFPVNEMTIAGNLKDMFRNLTPASDLDYRRGVDSPSVRIEGLTVAGL